MTEQSRAQSGKLFLTYLWQWQTGVRSSQPPRQDTVMLMNRSRRYFVEQTDPRTLGIAPLDDQGEQA